MDAEGESPEKVQYELQVMKEKALKELQSIKEEALNELQKMKTTVLSELARRCESVSGGRKGSEAGMCVNSIREK